MSMNKYQVKGRVKEAKGKIKEVTGKLLGNENLETCTSRRGIKDA